MKLINRIIIALSIALSACGIKGERSSESETKNAARTSQINKIAELQSGGETLEIYTGDESLLKDAAALTGEAQLYEKTITNEIISGMLKSSTSEYTFGKVISVYREISGGELGPYKMVLSDEIASYIKRNFVTKENKTLKGPEELYCSTYLRKEVMNVPGGYERITCVYDSGACYDAKGVPVQKERFSDPEFMSHYTCQLTPEQRTYPVTDLSRISAIDVRFKSPEIQTRFEIK